MLVPGGYDVTYDTLPEEPSQRHEALVGVFGQHLMWLLNTSLVRTAELLTSAESRRRLASLYRKPYEPFAEYPSEVREASLNLVRATTHAAVQRLVWLFTGEGFDDRLGPNHVIRFRLVMEICDAETGEVVEEDDLNRGGRRSFSEYWGRWLNRYGKVGLPDPPPDVEGGPAAPWDEGESTG